MKCARCQEEIPAGEEMDFYGQTLCEDCYIGAVEPPRPCDVAAVHSAKVARKMAGQVGTEGLTELQKEIYNFIKSKGKVKREEIARHFKLASWEVDKQFAVLRHCELIRGMKEGKEVYITLMEEGKGSLNLD